MVWREVGGTIHKIRLPKCCNWLKLGLTTLSTLLFCIFDISHNKQYFKRNNLSGIGN